MFKGAVIDLDTNQLVEAFEHNDESFVVRRVSGYFRDLPRGTVSSLVGVVINRETGEARFIESSATLQWID